MDLDDFLDRLDGVQKGNNYWKARCPAHDDQSPSLSVRRGRDGSAVVHCFAGCRPQEIHKALGTLSASASSSPEQPGVSRRGYPSAFDAEAAALRAVQRQQNGTWFCRHRYPYVDAEGHEVVRVLRFEKRGEAEKTFRPIYESAGVWAIGLPQGQLPLYARPQIEHESPVLFVEGEKAADAAIELGLSATTCIGGANASSRTNLAPLAGREVVLWPDNDPAGEAWRKSVVAQLGRLDPPPQVRVVQPSGLPPKGDIVEFVEQCPRVNARARVDELMRNAVDEPTKSTFSPPLTDSGNAERFAAQFRRCHRFVYSTGSWLAWDGKRWAVDGMGAAMAATKAVARSIYAEASREPDDDQRMRIARWAKATEHVSRREALLRLARSEDGVPLAVDQLDTHGMFLNLQNGTLDLRTAKLRAHSWSDLITKICPVAYEEDVTCPAWERFLEQVLPSRSVREFIQRAVGVQLDGIRR